MSIAEQALLLLDTVPSNLHRKSLDNFFSLDSLIGASLGASCAAPSQELAAKPEDNRYSVASRMNRSDYEEQAKAEALFQALKQLRANNVKRPLNGRVIRGS